MTFGGRDAGGEATVLHLVNYLCKSLMKTTSFVKRSTFMRQCVAEPKVCAGGGGDYG